MLKIKSEKPIHNYADLDKKLLVPFRDEKIIQAKKFGYDYVSQATVELYRKYQSQRIVGIILELTEEAIRHRLNFYKEPRRGAGGPPGCAGNKIFIEETGQKG